MDSYLPLVERELALFRLLSREFSAHFPKVAGNLQLAGDTCADPHVERMIEGFALIVARLMKQLDDNYVKFTESYLEVLFPHYLRPFPSCAIARLYPTVKASDPDEIKVIARGTEMSTQAIQKTTCKFRTAYDVTAGPVALSAAQFDAVIAAPGGIRLPVGVTSAIAITIEATSSLSLAQTKLSTLRVFIEGDPSFCAALRDALFMRVASAYVQAEGCSWQTLRSVPVGTVGFSEDDALIPFASRSHQAYRILTEYFTFPEKFNFFDIDLAALISQLPEGCRRLTLHLALTGVGVDSNVARMLASLSSNNLLLGCAPVINLFKKAGAPIELTHLHADYPLIGDANHARSFEVHTVDSVQMVRRSEQGETVTEFTPFYSVRHGDTPGKRGQYYVTRRDEVLALKSPGHEHRIAFVDINFQPLAIEKTAVSIELTCSNRDLPTKLRCGLPDGDLFPPEGTDGFFKLLRRPTSPCRFGAGYGAHWRLISHLTLNHHSLLQQGLPAFREMLTLFDMAQAPHSQRQIAGIVGLDHSQTTAWIRDKRGASLVHGVEVRLTLDAEAFAGSGIYVFAQVIDQFLGLYVQINNFTELVILSSNSGEEIIRCKPRNGDLNLV
jgi:type VI secretion system protein ImpG